MSGSLGVLTLDLVAKTVNFEQPLKKAEQQAGTSSKNIVSSMEKVEKQSEATSRAIGTFGTTLKASLAAVSIGSVVRIADEYTQTAARISQATKSTAEYDMVQKHLYNTANGTYRALKEAQEVYLATSGGLQELGYNTQQVLAISDSLSYSFVHNATAVDKAQSAMDAYGKILDIGKVEADGWISLMRAAPNILNDVAKATGKSTAEIRKLGAEGKLAAADLHKGLLLSADANKALADAMVNSAADGGQKLSNAISRTVGELNRGTGATGIFADGLGIVADNIEVVAGGVAVAAAYMAGTYLSALGTSTVAGYAKVTAHIAEVKALQLANEITAVRTARIVQSTRVELANAEAQAVRMTGMQRVAFVEKTLIPLRQANETALKADTIAQNANNASKLTAANVGQGLRGILGGPVGLGMTVATVAASYLLLSNNAEKNTVSLRENNGAVGDAIQKYSELSAIQRTDQIAAEKKKLEELNEQYRKSSTELMVYATNMGSVADVQTQSQAVLSQLFSQYKETGDLETFNRNVQSSGQISQDAKDKVANLASSVEKVGIEAKTQKAFIGQLNGEFNNTRAAASGAAGAIRDVAAATSEYTSSLNSRLFDAAFKNGVISRGKTAEEASLLLEAYRENEKKGIQGVTIEQKKRIAEIVNQGKITEQRRKAELDASKLARASAKSDASEAKRQAEEAKRLNEEIAQLKYEVNYRYSTREVQLQYDLEKEKSEIRKAFSDSPAQMANYLAWAQKKHDAEKQLYEIELGYELYAFKMNEEEKLNVQREIENRRIGLMAESFKGERETRRKALNEEHERNIAWAKLEVQQRISDAGESLRTDIQNLDIQYDYERRRIELNSEYAKDEKRQLIELSKAAQDLEKRQMNQDAIANWGGTFSEMTGTRDQYSLDQTRFRRTDESQDVFDTSMALAETAAEREAIWQAHHDRMQMIETDWQSKSIGLQAGYGAQFAGLMQGMVSETSSAYAVLGGIQKGAALFSTAMNSYTAISAAWASAPFPYNLPAVGMATMETGLLQAAVSALSPRAYATGGLITGPGTGTSDDIPIRASNGEFMMRYAATQKIGIADLNYMNRYGEIPQRQSTALTPKVGSGLPSTAVNQKQAAPNVNLNPNFVIVDEREKLGDYMFGPDGKKAMVKFFKQNRRELGLA
ncbi:tape measure protein [Acinetobacter lwoffii]|uniref:tape measure protein n=1 Tax=Acinetobacter lwoffii TaxID=28090 RepID=UPI000A3261B9|nr:tape measure protein [Acinetobacter lwoffii]